MKISVQMPPSSVSSNQVDSGLVVRNHRSNLGIHSNEAHVRSVSFEPSFRLAQDLDV